MEVNFILVSLDIEILITLEVYKTNIIQPSFKFGLKQMYVGSLVKTELWSLDNCDCAIYRPGASSIYSAEKAHKV